MNWQDSSSSVGTVEASVALTQLKVLIDFNNQYVYQGLRGYLNEILMTDNAQTYCQNSGYDNLNECYLREGLFLPDTGLEEHNKLTFSLVCENLQGKEGFTTRYITSQNGKAIDMINGPYLISFNLPGHIAKNLNGQLLKVLAKERANNTLEYTPVDYQLKAGDRCSIEASPNSMGAIINVKFENPTK
ncbi:hypothetical protein [Zooshikella harenae]|uniref:Uncharacterized protein n=1 Tax=Zooshikella harenae TaxID=2827238 RepID=A0ABS5ZHG9_9GAMM|nr:hypothetical protein [Zooshikella harenae]MBU2713513.1 hypothetical protein [Zooshikella harenae]